MKEGSMLELPRHGFLPLFLALLYQLRISNFGDTFALKAPFLNRYFTQERSKFELSGCHFFTGVACVIVATLNFQFWRGGRAFAVHFERAISLTLR